ncbi:universal stress protein [Halegenticoccus tardaugens]|uniref:universal stress protein n=1 Tax=Halegenticoccus tardaugens TaxID=2071624 RepID=UPI0013E99015|nr:universal stress protein [Halegenticoccus tardaugens]
MRVGSTVALQSLPSDGPTAPAGEAILVPILEADETSESRVLASALAAERGAEILFLRPVYSPGSMPVEFDGETRAEHHLVAKHVWRTTKDLAGATDVSGEVLVGRDPVRTVSEVVDGRDGATVVLQESPSGDFWNGVRQSVVERIATHVDADVVVANGRGTLDTVSSILVPVAGGPHSGFAVDAATALARRTGAWVDLVHVVDPDASDEERHRGEERLAAARERTDGFERVDPWLLEAEDVAGAIIEQADYYDVTVLGAPTKSRLRQFVFGSTTDAVRRDADAPVVIARRRTGDGWLGRWLKNDE